MININPLSELDGSNLDYGDRDLMAAINISRLSGNSVVTIGSAGKVAANKNLADNVLTNQAYNTATFSDNVGRYEYLSTYYFDRD